MDFKYRIIDGEATIYHYIGASHPFIIIPEFIDGYRVTSISGALFAYERSLIGVTIPNSIKFIALNCFHCCDNLAVINGVELKEGLNIINDRFILSNHIICTISYEICGDCYCKYNYNDLYFINNRTFTGKLIDLI